MNNKPFGKQKRIFAVILSITFILLFALSACSQPDVNNNKSYGYNGTVDGVMFSLSDLGTSADIHTEIQNEFIAFSKGADYDLNNVLLIAGGTKELSLPMPIRFSWTASATSVIDYTLKISEYEDMSEPLVYSIDSCEAEIYNLKIGTQYYWTVTANTAEKSVESGVAAFATNGDYPRNVYIDGVTNCRDLGGYKTQDGKIVRQGLIYRTGRFNQSGADEAIPEVTEKGKFQALNELRLKTEIDLRKIGETSNITSSVLGDSVNYVSCPMEYTGGILEPNTDEIIHVFSVLADKNNYPVFFHCHIGTDRTGMVAYLINGLLGVSQKDLYFDYLFSNFGAIGSSRGTDIIEYSYVKTIDEYRGSSLNEKIENYLLDIGVPKKDIDSLKAIML